MIFLNQLFDRFQKFLLKCLFRPKFFFLWRSIEVKFWQSRYLDKSSFKMPVLAKIWQEAYFWGQVKSKISEKCHLRSIYTISDSRKTIPQNDAFGLNFITDVFPGSDELKNKKKISFEVCWPKFSERYFFKVRWGHRRSVKASYSTKTKFK